MTQKVKKPYPYAHFSKYKLFFSLPISFLTSQILCVTRDKQGMNKTSCRKPSCLTFFHSTFLFCGSEMGQNLSDAMSQVVEMQYLIHCHLSVLNTQTQMETRAQ